MQETERELLVTPKRASELLAISRSTLWRMAKAGKLTKVQVFENATRFKYQEILDIVNGR